MNEGLNEAGGCLVVNEEVGVTCDCMSGFKVFRGDWSYFDLDLFRLRLVFQFLIFKVVKDERFVVDILAKDA